MFSEISSCSNSKPAGNMTREVGIVDPDTSLTALHAADGDESELSVFTRQLFARKNPSVGYKKTNTPDELDYLTCLRVKKVHTENNVAIIPNYGKSSKSCKRQPIPIHFNENFFNSDTLQVLQHFMNTGAYQYLFPVSKKVILSKFCFGQFLASRVMPLTSGFLFIETPFLRISSFRCWPNSSGISANSLADAGFCCENAETETVKCSSCQLTFQVSELHGMGPLEYHIYKSPNCIYSKSNAPRSRSYSTNAEERTVDNASNDTIMRFNSTVNEINYPINSSQAPATPTVDSTTTGIHCTNVIPSSKNSATDDVAIPEYKDCANRLATFRYCRFEDKPDFGDLAEAGFYYTGEGEDVCCFQCDIKINNWSQQDNPWVEHARRRPDCPFLMSNSAFIPFHVNMIQHSSRIETFTSSWPRNIPQTPDMMANAGFFYTGKEDIVRCHHCDGGLMEWEPQDEPWIEHARWFPFCKFLIRTKGIGFVETQQHKWMTHEIPNTLKLTARINNGNAHTQYNPLLRFFSCIQAHSSSLYCYLQLV